MSKTIDKKYVTSKEVIHYSKLPVIHWKDIGAAAPTHVDITNPSTLPAADIAIITWTSAEWSAFDHVFVNSEYERSHYDTDWRQYWHPFPHGSEESKKDFQVTLDFYFKLVEVNSDEAQADGSKKKKPIKVLLVKSENHLAHPPWRTGLENMVQKIITGAGVKAVVSTGTAGAAKDDQKLGDVVFTTSAKIKLEKVNNLPCDYNNTVFHADNTFENTDLIDKVRDNLMMPISNVWTNDVITVLLDRLNSEFSSQGHTYTYADLVNDALKPSELTENYVQISNKTPLFTTDFYFTTDTANPLDYSFLEMDDAVIAHVAKKAGVKYGFIRNISDPVIVATDSSNNPVPKSVQGDWSGMIYSYSGFYTSFNSALAAWASIKQLV